MKKLPQMSEKPRDNVVVIFLCCKWEDTEMYCLSQLVNLTLDHMVMYLDLGDERLDPEKLLIDAKRHNLKTKLLVLTNVNKSITKYNQIFMLHIKFKEKFKAGVPFFNNSIEEQLCPEHDRMTVEMKKSATTRWLSLRPFLNDENPYYTNKNNYF